MEVDCSIIRVRLKSVQTPLINEFRREVGEMRIRDQEGLKFSSSRIHEAIFSRNKYKTKRGNALQSDADCS